MKTTLLSFGRVVEENPNIYRENVLLRLINFNLNFAFILILNLSWFFILITEDVQKHCHYITYLLLNKK